MSAENERRLILDMINNGKITAEEGAKLLSAMGDIGGTSGASGQGRAAGPGRWLRIRVTDIASGKSKASVQIPIGLIDAGMKIGAHFAPGVEGVDMSNVMDAIRSGATGKITDVTDDGDGEHVEIFVE